MLVMASWWGADKLEDFASDHLYQNVFGTAASLILFGLGLSAVWPRKRNFGHELDEKRPVLKHRYAFLQGFSINTTNPSNWIFWLGVATAAHADAPDNDETFVRLFMLAAVVTLFCSDLTKAYIAHRLGRRLKPVVLQRVIQASGVILICVSLWILYGIAQNPA
jgi:threonine/homoserine/homoserine lactone efflux protein